MNFYVNYFGCRTNQAEIQDWIIDLENAGYRLTNSIDDAHFGIINTCSVTEKAENDVIRYIGKMYRHSDIPWIITGCTISKEKEKLQDHYKNYYFFDNAGKEEMVPFIKESFPVEDNVVYHSSFRSRIFLKIHDGCNFRCSYCIVPFLRGKSVSVPSDTVVERARYYASLGYREVILSGVNLSSFGYDLFPRENLLQLIQRLNDIDDLDFIRLSSLDPRFIKYQFIKELSLIPKLADSFHFSFQSGSNPVLRRMKRGNKTGEYMKIMENFIKFFPDANYGADLIVGFPEETEREFWETLAFIRDSHLNYMHVFPFSPREGTRAFTMEPVPPDIVKKRLKELKEINRGMRSEYRQRFMDRTLEGIVIKEDPGYSLTVTKNFLSVRTPPVRGFKKRKVFIKITGMINENLCEGTIEQP